MGKSNRLRFSAGLDRKPEWTGAGLRRFYCTAIFHGCKNVNFQMKNCDIFLIFAQNIDRGYSVRRF